MNIEQLIVSFADWLSSSKTVTIDSSAGSQWVEEFEAKLPFKLPRSFYLLISRYDFPLIELERLAIFGTRPNEDGVGRIDVESLKDKVLAPFLHANKLIQFGRPNELDYDPICFDFRGSKSRSECPVVRVDHEQILCNNRLKIKGPVASSFADLIQEIMR